MGIYEIPAPLDWTKEVGDEGSSLHSPVTDEQLTDEMPPAFMLDDPRLARGFDNFNQAGGAFQLAIWYARDDKLPEDLNQEAFRDQMSPQYGVQALGHTTDGTQLDVVTNRLVLPDARRTSYHDQLTAVSRSARIATFCCGLEVDMAGKPAGDVEWALQDMASMTELQYRDETDEAGDRYAATHAITKHHYDWYRVLRFGEQFIDMAVEEHVMGNTIQNPMLAAPVRNAGMTAKFESMLPQPVQSVVADPEQDVSAIAWEVRVAGNGFVSYDDLETMPRNDKGRPAIEDDPEF